MSTLSSFLKKGIDIENFIQFGQRLLGEIVPDESLHQVFLRLFHRTYVNFDSTHQFALKVLLLKFLNKRMKCLANRKQKLKKILDTEKGNLLNSSLSPRERIISGQLFYLVSTHVSDSSFNELFNYVIDLFEKDDRDVHVEFYFTIERFLFDPRKKHLDVIRLVKCLKKKKRKMKFHILRALFISARMHLLPYLKTIDSTFGRNCEEIISLKSTVFGECSELDVRSIFEKYTKTYSVETLVLFNSLLLRFDCGKNNSLLNLFLSFFLKNIQRNTIESLKAVFNCIMGNKVIYQHSPFLQSVVKMFLWYKTNGNYEIKELCQGYLNMIHFVLHPISFPIFAPFQEDIFNQLSEHKTEMEKNLERNGERREIMEIPNKVEKPTVVVVEDIQIDEVIANPLQELPVIEKEPPPAAITPALVINQKKRKRENIEDVFSDVKVPKKKKQKINSKEEPVVENVEVNYDVPGDDIDFKGLDEIDLD